MEARLMQEPTPEEVAEFVDGMIAQAESDSRVIAGWRTACHSVSYPRRYMSRVEWAAGRPQWRSRPGPRAVWEFWSSDEMGDAPSVTEVQHEADKLLARCSELGVLEHGPVKITGHERGVSLCIRISRMQTEQEFENEHILRAAAFRRAYLWWAAREGEWDEPKSWMRYAEELEAVAG